jgi:ABC-type Fe3+-hydroxamate transport system substrate-binding protein
MRKRLTNTNDTLIFFLTVVLTVFYVDISCALIVTDEIGRSVNISPTPQRIVSLAMMEVIDF